MSFQLQQFVPYYEVIQKNSLLFEKMISLIPWIDL